MLSLYILCMLAGGVVLAASAFAGHDSADGGGGEVHAGDVHAAEAGTDGADGHDGQHHVGAKLPFLSMRFWTWGATFFGLTGAVLTWADSAAGLVPVLAGVVGAGSGWGATYVLDRLTRDAVGVLPEASSHIGREGKLLLPLRKGERSKVRLAIGGVSTDLLAETDAETEIEAGSPVLIVGMRGVVAMVESTRAALGAAEESDESGKEES
jgi:hypothetical protein